MPRVGHGKSGTLEVRHLSAAYRLAETLVQRAEFFQLVAKRAEYPGILDIPVTHHDEKTLAERLLIDFEKRERHERVIARVASLHSALSLGVVSIAGLHFPNAHTAALRLYIETVERATEGFPQVESIAEIAALIKVRWVDVRSRLEPFTWEHQFLSALLEIEYCRARDRISGDRTETVEVHRWSKPDFPSQWAKRFGMSWDRLKELFDSGAIRNQRLSSKAYRVHKDDLPE